MRLTIVVIFVILGMGSALVSFWHFSVAEPPVKDWRVFASDEYGNPKGKFRVGETIYSHGEFVMTRTSQRTTLRSIVNADTAVIMVNYEPVTEVLKEGKYKRTFALLTPRVLPPGHYYYRLQILYPLNPLRREEQLESPRINFEVMP